MRRSPANRSIALLALVTLVAACDSAPRAVTAPSFGTQPIPLTPTTPATPVVVRVAVAYVSGTADTATWTLRIGGSAQLQATAFDSAGNVVTGAAIYQSSNPAALKVDSVTGVATALAVGEATVTAVVNGVSGSAHVFRVQAVTTTPATPTTPTTPSLPPAPVPVPSGPPNPSTVTLQVVRFDGGSGAATVSAGVPLMPGALYRGQEGSVRVSVAGVEQPVYVTGLSSLHPDGSLRAILVQLQLPALPSGQAVAAQLDIGTARAAAMTLASPVAVPGAASGGAPNGLPQAAVLPNDPSYLIATDLVGPTVAASASGALGGSFARYETDFAKFADSHWTTYGADYLNTDYYDRVLIYYAMWVRTGNPTYWARAGQIAYDYRTRYLEPNAYGSSPHWAQLEGVEKHYLLTGDEASRQAVVRTAGKLNLGFILAGHYLDGSAGESRIAARVLHAQLLAWRLTPAGAPAVTGPGVTGYSWGKNVETVLGKIAAWQQPDGSYPAVVVCGGQLNYMVGLLNDALIKTYDYYLPAATPRAALQATIQALVQKGADYMWSTQWRPTDQSFNYASVDCSSKSAGGPTPAPDLNNLIAASFAWVYKQTGDATYLSDADAIFAGGVAQAYLSGTKQFNEEYTSSFRYLGYR